MANAGMKVGDSVPAGIIVAYGQNKGMDLEAIEAELALSANKGRIMLLGNDVHLTLRGFQLSHPANDSSTAPVR